MAVTTSMKALTFDTRSAIAKECINRVRLETMKRIGGLARNDKTLCWNVLLADEGSDHQVCGAAGLREDRGRAADRQVQVTAVTK